MGPRNILFTTQGFAQKGQKFGRFSEQYWNALQKRLSEEMGMSEDWFRESFNALKDSVSDNRSLLRSINDKIETQNKQISELHIELGKHSERIHNNHDHIDHVSNKIRWVSNLIITVVVTGVAGIIFWLIKLAILN